MKNIEINYNEEKNDYEFTCPFCNKVNYPNDGPFCDHVIFAFDEVNGNVIYISDEVYDIVKKVLMKKSVSFLEYMYEMWEEEYQPCENRKDDEEEWDNAKEELINWYIDVDGPLSIDDFITVLKASSVKDKVEDMVIASTTEGFDGNTYYVLAENM